MKQGQEPFDDETIMRIGKKWKGERLADIPDSYFIWFWDQNRHKFKAGLLDGFVLDLMTYIEDSFENLPGQ